MAEGVGERAWHQEIPRELLPGPSARSLRLASFAVIGAGATAFVVLAAMFPFATTGVIANPDGWPFWVALVVFISSAFLVGRGSFSPLDRVVEKRTRRERAAGYTTERHAALEKECPVDVVDARSRRVIRLAGEPVV